MYNSKKKTKKKKKKNDKKKKKKKDKKKKKKKKNKLSRIFVKQVACCYILYTNAEKRLKIISLNLNLRFVPLKVFKNK